MALFLHRGLVRGDLGLPFRLAWHSLPQRHFSLKSKIVKDEPHIEDSQRPNQKDAEEVYPLSQEVKGILASLAGESSTPETFVRPRSELPVCSLWEPNRTKGPLHILANYFLTRVSNSLMKRFVETEHDREEFLRGAAIAVKTVFKNLEDKDWESLQDMLSAERLRLERDFAERLQVHGLTYKCGPATEVSVSQPRFLVISPKDRLAVACAEGDEQTDGSLDMPEPVGADAATTTATATAAVHPPVMPGLANMNQAWARICSSFSPSLQGCYQVALVDIHGPIVREVLDSNGVSLLRLHSEASRSWIFVRGPLPAGLPKRELQLLWKLVDDNPLILK